ncbi:MAG: DUF4412 domain-containing protein [Balneolales bacterium]
MNLIYINTVCRTLILLMGVCYCLLSVRQVSAQQFEGAITYKLEADGERQNLTYFMKSNKARIEVAIEQLGGNAVVLIDSEADQMTVLMDQLSMYMRIPFAKESEIDSDEDTGNFQLTGKTRTIADVNCHQYLHTDGDGIETEVWTPVEDNFGSFHFRSMGGNMSAVNQSVMPDFTFFPFLLISNGKDQKMRMEVTSLDEKSLDDNLFTVPSNFREMNMKMFGN